jgi:hypothetical protein
MNASFSFLGGTVLAWGIIGPSIVARGLAFGEPVSPLYPGYISYNNMVMVSTLNTLML